MTTTSTAPPALPAPPSQAGSPGPPAAAALPVPALPVDVDLGSVPLDRLAEELTTHAAHLAAAEARFCEVLGVFEEREGWAAVGVRSCAQWLAWRCGLSPGAARERVRVARALRALPVLRATFAAGRLSYSQVRAVSRVATATDEQQLVDWALHCPAWQLERLLRGVRRVRAQQAEDHAADVRAHRRVHWHWADDGSLVLSARLPPEQGARLVAAVEALAEQMLRDDARAPGPDSHADADARAGADADTDTGAPPSTEQPPPGQRRPPGAGRFDAGLAARLRDRGGWDALCADALSHLGERACTVTVDVTVDAAVLEDPTADGTCGLLDGPALSTRTVTRLLCDAATRPALTSGGDLLHQGRTSRAPTLAQRRALARRDGGCAYPGCGAQRFLDAHHVVSWQHGGPTDLDNLVLLCRRHHQTVHDHGYRLTMPTPGHVQVTDPHGQPVPVVPPRPAGDPRRLHDAVPHARTLPPDALEPRWHGDRLDLDLALLSLPRLVGTG